MILKDTLKKIAEIQKEAFDSHETGLPRESANKLDLKSPHAIIISGIRRCGKSTLLRQLMKESKQTCYFNFEDERASGFELGDFERLNVALQEAYGNSKTYFLDEIQNVEGWERFIRKMQDLGKKFVITGSNASLLSKELGTKLTGRHVTQELFPFSYTEMLKLTKKVPSPETFKEYMEKGGFPEFLVYKNPQYLQQLFNDIILRDIVVRHKLKTPKPVKELALYLMTNSGKEVSYNRLKKTFNFGSANTVISYMGFYEENYLIFTVPKFSYSYKKQIANPKKVYSIDPGLARANSVSFSEDLGRILENIVFMHLRKDSKGIYFYREKNECDFLVKEKERITKAIQVCHTINEENKDREIKGLKEAMEEFNLTEGTIITMNQSDCLDNIDVIPAWKWLTK